MATTVFPEAGDQITEAAWTSANKTIAVATEYRVNGYALSAGTGLNVDISSGTCFVNGFEVVSDGTQIEALSPNSTNYVYLNDDGTFTVNTSGTQPADTLFLGTATTNASAVTAVSHLKDIANDYNVAKVKTADESVASSTTLQDDDALVWTAGTGETYELLIVLKISTGSGNLKWDLKGFGTSDYSYQEQNSIIFAEAGTPENTSNTAIIIRSVVTTSTSGTVGLEWAQNVSDASNSTIQAGSFLYARRLLG